MWKYFLPGSISRWWVCVKMWQLSSLGSPRCFTAPTEATSHLPCSLFSASDFGTRRGCQESSYPHSLSSFDPHPFLFFLWPLKSLHCGQLLSFAALLCSGRSPASERRRKKGTRRAASPPMCRSSLAAHFGAFHSLAGGPGMTGCWRLTPDDQR